MSIRMPPAFADPAAVSLPLHVIAQPDLAAWRDAQPAAVRRWVTECGFKAALGALLLLPSDGGGLAGAVFGFGDAASRARGRFHIARAVPLLPAGAWHLADMRSAATHKPPPDGPPPDGPSPDGPADGASSLFGNSLDEAALNEAALGWLLALYRFDRYRPSMVAAPAPQALLAAPKGIDADRIATLAGGEALTRDLINTPAQDMGTAALEEAFRDLGDRFGAQVRVIAGHDLLAQNFPMIHAVGRAAEPADARGPRLLDLRWGDAGPRLTLVGKGVCFDTGGLDLKPAAGMGLMKKDMGGAATVMGLAQIIMTLGLRLRLRVLVPAVENAVAGSAFRPQDILTSRKGLTVEVNNTDAEGRLILADALAYGAEEAPDLMISMATLTGAARVAVGPDLAPFFTDHAVLAQALEAAGTAAQDPVWRLPFWDPYEPMIEPGIADLDNAPSGGLAGAITAALFLRRFAEGAAAYAHFDIYGWQPVAAPGRPKGGVGQGARAILGALPQVLGPEVLGPGVLKAGTFAPEASGRVVPGRVVPGQVVPGS